MRGAENILGGAKNNYGGRTPILFSLIITLFKSKKFRRLKFLL